MRVKFSSFLTEAKPFLENLLKKLSQEYEYVSILGSDTFSKRYIVTTKDTNIGDSSWNERGFVVRVYNGINYSEFSFNEIADVEEIVDKIRNDLIVTSDRFKRSGRISKYPLIEEAELEGSFEENVEILPSKISTDEKVRKLSAMKDRAYKISSKLVNFWVIYEEVNVNKYFLSTKRRLSQSYVWSQGYLQAFARDAEKTKYSYEGFSGLKGVELLDEMENGVEKVVKEAETLLGSEKIEPGEYDVICSPDVAGLIAHEAFGHGVEMDMFVKERAKATEYMGKEIASPLVTMHDGAAAARQVSSYFFDDEGTLATDTVIIDHGILKTGISDLLSAMKLGTRPTGNGKRESFERKAYSRMTNTFFASGQDKLEDMISSIKYGYLLEKMSSGMEDPKNWGIQCMILYGREIKEGKLTDRIVSPIIMTGYVPALLKSISMVSEDLQLSGTGACGKGHKEFVKVSSGGPYIKAKVRLG
jgi:TldD protein|uniref:TldD/PmbA family protein n=1 Tax=Mesoaciditoga lauensis TaxID=1495039 RepID=A0A7V3RDW2_9BACT